MTSSEVLSEYRFYGFTVDVRRRKLTGPNGESIALNSRAFDTLLVLLDNHSETLSKTTLMQAVWSSAVVEENNLNQAIFSLRKAFGDSSSNSQFILTIPGRGYCFVSPVEIQWTHQDSEIEKLTAISAATKQVQSATFRYLNIVIILLVAVGVGYFLQHNSSNAKNGLAGLPALASPVVFQPQEAGDVLKNSVAVLPFMTFESGKGSNLFVLGLHDELISQLSKIRSLQVISRNSVLSLIDQDLALEEIAQLLQVESFISGTVLFVGEKARINLDMYDAHSGISVWSRSYEANKKDLSEMFSVQSLIALDVAGALETEIRQTEQLDIYATQTTSIKAYRNLLLAKIAHYEQDFSTEWARARQAIELDPDYFEAHAAFSSVNSVLVTFPLSGMSRQDHIQLAMASAQRMIELQPENNLGYSLKAIVLGTNRDWSGITNIIDKIESLDEPLSNLNYMAIVLLTFGDFSRAIEVYQANLKTEPMNLFSRGFLMAALELTGNSLEAQLQYEKGEQLSSVWWGDTVNLFLDLGRGDPLEDVEELTMISAELKTVLANINDAEKLQEGLQAFRLSASKNSAESIHYAALAAHTGDNHLALELFKSALQDNWTSLFWVWLPVFDNTRKLPGFKTLLEESGVVTHWRKNGWPDVCQPAGDSFTCEWSAYAPSNENEITSYPSF